MHLAVLGDADHHWWEHQNAGKVADIVPANFTKAKKPSPARYNSTTSIAVDLLTLLSERGHSQEQYISEMTGSTATTKV